MGEPGDKSEMRWYNGHAAADFSTAYGLTKLGVENCKPFFTRGHLVDMVGLKGRMIEVGEVITVADLRAAFQKQGMSESDVKPGDAIFFNTGWSQLWGKNNDKFNSGEPGIGLEIAKWVRRADRGQEISVRLRLRPIADRGCDRLAGQSDCHNLSCATLRLFVRDGGFQ
jgi:hypothetical protein